MIETHAIRLRGPWECRSDDGQWRRIHMPTSVREILADDLPHRLVCRRRFGCPTCLDPHERVWLIVDRPAFSGEATLNGEPLGFLHSSSETVEFEVTGRLAERNQLDLAIDLARGGVAHAPTAIDDLLFADVRLEIRG